MKAADIPLHYNAASILEHNVIHRPLKVALYTQSNEFTFSQINAESNKVANALRKLGLRSGETVALLSTDSKEWVTAFFGVLKSGAIAAGLNTLLTAKDYEYILNDCGARIAFVHESILPKIKAIQTPFKNLEHIVVIGHHEPGTLGYESFIEKESTEFETVSTHREDYSCLNYSSGTTGTPKGILHAHKDLPLTAQLWGVNVLGLTESDRTFALAKLFFTFGLGGNLIFPWYVGASTILYSGSPRDARSVLDVIDQKSPTVFYNVPTGYASAMAIDNWTQEYDLSSLRLCVSAGEALPAPIWTQWKEQTGLDIIDGIGSTENFHIFLSNRPGDIRPGSSGKPFQGYELKIVDEDGDEVNPGEIGNLMVKGETSALGYLRDYEKSCRTFRGQWLFTGDKYYMDQDGYFWHAGRSDDMMKVGGIWVSPVEVESTILEHPAVFECAVVPKRDPSDLVKPRAYIVVNEHYTPGSELTETLLDYCSKKMAAYKRPRSVEYVTELPKTATGKVQRYRLRQAA